jgi:general secretion pathway protein F
MPVYAYRSTTMDGAVAEGFIEAADERAAAERLKSTGVIPIHIAAPREKSRLRLPSLAPGVDLLSFTTELSALLNAGLPLDRALNILIEIADERRMRGIVESLLKSIREGGSFSDALQAHPGVFPRLYVNMVRAGESGGVLDVVLEKLAEFLESSKELKDHVVSAMIYPAILILTGGISIVVLLAVVLPKFTGIFSELGGALPLPTQILLAASGAVQAAWWVLLAAAAAGTVLLRRWIATEDGRLRWDALKLRLLGDVLRRLETARFCRTLGTLLRSGVPLLQALNNSRDVIGNRAMALSIDEVSRGVKEGKGLAGPLAATRVFPPLALSMIRVGEETGQLDAMLLRVAVTYEKSLREAIRRFVSFLEPAMILGMGLLIGFIVIAILMAVFSMTDLPF